MDAAFPKIVFNKVAERLVREKIKSVNRDLKEKLVCRSRQITDCKNHGGLRMSDGEAVLTCDDNCPAGTSFKHSRCFLS